VNQFSGVFTALVTPFLKGQIDFDSLKNLVSHQMQNGVRGFVISGTTGESPTLTLDEKKRIFLFVRELVGRDFPLVVGTGTNSTAESIHLTREACDWGADAVLVVVPYYNKPPQRGLVAHFKSIAEQCTRPVLLYNVPSRTITSLELESIVELSHVDKIIGIKEASGQIEFAKRILKQSRPGFLLTSGDDGSFIEFILAGGHGIISVASHILPKEFSRWMQAASSARGGDAAALREDFARHQKVIEDLYLESNPIGVKMALYKMGIIASPELRLPLVRMQDEFANRLQISMRSVGLLGENRK